MARLAYQRLFGTTGEGLVLLAYGLDAALFHTHDEVLYGEYLAQTLGLIEANFCVASLLQELIL